MNIIILTRTHIWIPPFYPTFVCLNWNDWYWVWEARLPVERE